MSKEALESVLGRTILDSAFRDLLFADPDQALSHFELTPAEKDNLKNIDSETLERMADILLHCPGWIRHAPQTPLIGEPQ